MHPTGNYLHHFSRKHTPGVSEARAEQLKKNAMDVKSREKTPDFFRYYY